MVEGRDVIVILAAGALASAVLIALLMPLLTRYALARPNARSSHVTPTPQGGGIAVIAVALAALAFAGGGMPTGFAVALVIATLGLAGLGALDDFRPLPVLPRFIAQAGLIAAVMITMPDAWRLAPPELGLPLIAERVVLTLALWWFVNLTNFIDGLDWITAADILPPMLTVAALSLIGVVPAFIGAVAAGLAAGMLGFAPFNKPRARVFLGDVGSLPIGLLAGVALIALAGQGHLAAAILLAAYPSLDATVTLLRRAARREKVWEAHRGHFYQQATDNGFTALSVSLHVFALNCGLAGLAILTVLIDGAGFDTALALVGVALAGLLCVRFARRRRAEAPK
jgi:UDP-N-acetylmuramyl pentapeptide phosphotransferase/UDP-N-acetylglucosamine-1-phosphate transferase